MEIRFTVPGEPVPKGRPIASGRHRSRGAAITFRTPEKTEEYEKRVRLVTQAARPTGWPMRCKFSVTIDVYRTIERGDWDNYGKALCDAINPRRAKGRRPAVPGVLWSDDGRARSGHVEIHEVETSPRMEVCVAALPVRCKLKSCGGRETLYPDADGRCETCAAKPAARRTA